MKLTYLKCPKYYSVQLTVDINNKSELDKPPQPKCCQENHFLQVTLSKRHASGERARIVNAMQTICSPFSDQPSLAAFVSGPSCGHPGQPPVVSQRHCPANLWWQRHNPVSWQTEYISKWARRRGRSKHRVLGVTHQAFTLNADMCYLWRKVCAECRAWKITQQNFVSSFGFKL